MTVPHQQPLPTSRTLILLASQVGGHPGVLSSEDGKFVVKPTFDSEITFYEQLYSEPAFSALIPFIPRFHATIDLQADNYTLPTTPSHRRAIVIENLCYPFSKPNVVDIKLGTVLHDDNASIERRARRESVAQATTTSETGIRIIGFQVHDMSTGCPKKTDKVYGKSLKASELSEGFCLFFPVETSGFKSTDESHEYHAITSIPTSSTGIPSSLLMSILNQLKNSIGNIRDALLGSEVRMVGASLLIIYETDLERMKCLPKAKGPTRVVDPHNTLNKGSIQYPLPCTANLIDFVHTKVTPNEGHDRGVIKGLDTVLRLLDERLQQIRDLGNSSFS